MGIALATSKDADVQAILHWAAQPLEAGGFGWSDCDAGDPNDPISPPPAAWLFFVVYTIEPRVDGRITIPAQTGWFDTAYQER